MPRIYGPPTPRPPKPEPTAEELAAAEAARLERRAAIRKNLATARVHEMRSEELRAEIQSAEQRLERLASEHEQRMAPVQDQLRACNQRIVKALADRQAADPSDTSERRRLLDQIADGNRQLEQDLAAEKAVLRRVRLEAQQHAMMRFTTSEADLRKDGIANPVLQAAAYAARTAASWAAARLKAAGKALREQSDLLREAENLGEYDNAKVYSRRVRNWAAEVAAATAANDAAMAASDAAHKAVIDE